MMDEFEKEIAALKSVYDALSSLDEDAQERVIFMVTSKLGIAQPSAKKQVSRNYEEELEPEDSEAENIEDSKNGKSFRDFADLHATAAPDNGTQRALLAGYWFQVCEGKPDFTGYAVNKELTHLGHKLANVTKSLGDLIKRKPQLVIQVHKSTKGKMGRKKYRLTAEGISAVEKTLR